MSLEYTDNLTVLASTSSTIVSTLATKYDVSKRQCKSIQFVGTVTSAGTAIFYVQVSNDGTNWITYNRLTDNVANSISQNNTRVGSSTISYSEGVSSKIYFFPTEDYFRMLRTYVTVSGTITVSAILQSAG